MSNQTSGIFKKVRTLLSPAAQNLQLDFEQPNCGYYQSLLLRLPVEDLRAVLTEAYGLPVTADALSKVILELARRGNAEPDLPPVKARVRALGEALLSDFLRPLTQAWLGRGTQREIIIRYTDLRPLKSPLDGNAWYLNQAEIARLNLQPRHLERLRTAFRAALRKDMGPGFYLPDPRPNPNEYVYEVEICLTDTYYVMRQASFY